MAGELHRFEVKLDAESVGVGDGRKGGLRGELELAAALARRGMPGRTPEREAAAPPPAQDAAAPLAQLGVRPE